MINQVNLNTANAFTTSIQDKNTTSEIPISNNPLSLPEGNIDTFDLQSNEKVDENKKEKKKKKPMPVWLKAILACVGTMAAVLGTGYVTTKLGYTPFKTDTKGLLNSRTTEFEKGAKAAVGGITSVMTLNSHCAQKSLEKLPTTHQGLIVVLDSQGAKGVKTLESKFKDKIIYGEELKLSELKDYDKLQKYVKTIAERIKGKESHENITFASENSRCANMLNAVLRAHGEDKKAQTYDFVEGGIPSHYFWGSKGLNSEKLDEAIWNGWREGFKINSEGSKPEAFEQEPQTKASEQEPQKGAETTAPKETETNVPKGTGTGTQPEAPAQTEGGSGNSVPVEQSEDDNPKETEQAFVSEFAKLFKNDKKGGKDGFNGKVSKIKDKGSFYQWLSMNAKEALKKELGQLKKTITYTREKGRRWFLVCKSTKKITIEKSLSEKNKFTVTIKKNGKPICDSFDISIQELEEISSRK